MHILARQVQHDIISHANLYFVYHNFNTDADNLRLTFPYYKSIREIANYLQNFSQGTILL